MHDGAGINAACPLDTVRGRNSVLAPHLHDLAAQSVDLHLDLVATSVAALDLPHAVVELDLLDGDDTPVEGHVANVIDGEVPGAGSGGEGGRKKGEKNDPQESTHDGGPVQDWG